MKFYLPLDGSPTPLIAEIADIIKTYYPIGIDINSPEYNENVGIRKIDNSIEEHMSNYNAYIKPWRLFLMSLPRGFKSKVQNTGLPHELTYSADLILEKYEDNSLIRIKRIHFCVSWLAPFYTIYGVDETFIKLENHFTGSFRHHHAINAITTSPYFEFKPGFDYLDRGIKEKFPDHKFIPFFTTMIFVKGMQTPYSNLDECRVYNALFNDSLDYVHVPELLRGELSYGAGNSNVSVILAPPPDDN